MAPRILLVLVLALLASGVAWLARDALRSRTQHPQLHVRILDPAGLPLPLARLRFRPGGWHAVDAQGRASLALPAVAAQESFVAETVRTGLDVQERTHALLDPSAMIVQRTPQGDWEVELRLEPAGVLRLFVGTTHLGMPRAWLPADPAGRWKAVGTQAVARPEHPASWFIRDGVTAVDVHLDGEAHPVHDTRVASTIHRMAAPRPGQTLEYRLEPEPRRLIRGRVEVPASWGDTPLQGQVRVRQILATEAIDVGAVALESDGTFQIPFAGMGNYEIQADLAWRGTTRAVRVLGGGEVILLLQSEPRMLEVVLTPAPSRRAFLELRLPDTPGGTPTYRVPLELEVSGAGRVLLAPREGLRLRAHVPHDDDGPDWISPEVSIDAALLSPPLVFPLSPAPSGSLTIALNEAARASFRGASIHVPGRMQRSLLRGMGAEQSYAFLPAGAVDIEVHWTDPTMATVFARAQVAVDAPGRLEIPREAGGLVEVLWPVPAGAKAPESLWLAWQEGAGPYDAPGQVPLTAVGAGRYRSILALRPGSYVCRIGPEGSPGSAAVTQGLVLRALSTTEVRVDAGP